MKLIPAQTGNIITDMWECIERFLSVDYWPKIIKMIKIIKTIKIIRIIKIIEIIKIIKMIRIIKMFKII